MEEGLKIWTDQKMIQSFTGVQLTDQKVKDLYRKFLDTVVEPPNFDDNKEYRIENGDEFLKYAINLVFFNDQGDEKEYGRGKGARCVREKIWLPSWRK